MHGAHIERDRYGRIGIAPRSASSATVATRWMPEKRPRPAQLERQLVICCNT